MIKPTYETERLILTPARPLMAAQVAAYYVRSKALLTAFEPIRDPDFYTMEGQRAILECEAAQVREDQGYRFYLSRKEQPNDIIGKVSLTNLIRGGCQSCFLGYTLGVQYRGQGYMTEAVNAIKQIAFQDLSLHRIEANIMPQNTASLRVVEKAGFQNEGIALRYLNIGGVWEDHIHMVIRDE